MPILPDDDAQYFVCGGPQIDPDTYRTVLGSSNLSTYGLRDALEELLRKADGKLFGDNVIGYRVQDATGKYRDDELKTICEQFNCHDDFTEFNDICFSLRSGDYNW